MADRTEVQIGEVVNGIRELQAAYLMERRIFLGGIALGILLIAFFSIMTAFGYIKKEDWVFAFAPPGVFVGMCTAAMTYFNKSLRIVDRLAGGPHGE